VKQFIQYILITVVFILIGWFANTAYHLPRSSNNPIPIARPTPLAKYTIENLSKADIKPSQIEIGKVLKDDPKFISYEFIMKFSPDLSNNLKTTSGLINIPKGTGKFPIIVMFRGFVDQKQYFTGEGTQHAAEVFAQNGFITVAPDFLGYGDSDTETSDIFESRFQTYVTAMTILKSIPLVKNWDDKNIFIWAHSNGGQIALTTLETTGVNYPIVLWAPVSQSFPYSILYYLDETADSGKYIITKLASFMNDYDVAKYSLTNYFEGIKAPIQLNQGTLDDAVPFRWSDILNKDLKSASVSAEYIKYPGADHNLQPGWNLVVANNLKFFKDHLAP